MRLGINIDHIATIREARGGSEPDPAWAVPYCEIAGADGITIHLREDRRHIKERDLVILKSVVSTRLNLEMALNDEIIDIAEKICPDQVTIVPEKRQELTTEGGLNVCANREKLEKVIKRFRQKGIEVALFIDPESAQVRASKEVSADAIELHTGAYSNANDSGRYYELKKLSDMTKLACDMGIEVHAGHGLNYFNTGDVVKIKKISELNIGHSIISRAVFVGMENAVRQMKQLIDGYDR